MTPNKSTFLLENPFEVKRGLFIRPGAIWYLPFDFPMEYPPKTLFPVEEDSDEYCILEDESHWKNSKGDYQRGTETKQVAVAVKVRPFLVIQKYDTLQELKSLVVPNWYGDCVRGYPISSLKNLEKNNATKIDVSRLKTKNDYVYLHYLPVLKEHNIDQESYVVLSQPSSIHYRYFTTHCGALLESEYENIQRKFINILDLQSELNKK